MIATTPPLAEHSVLPVEPEGIHGLPEQKSLFTTEFFLDLILPSAGLRCIVHFHEGRKVHTFHADNKRAAAKAAELDALGDGDVYFGCATFRDPGSRKGINAHTAKSLWLDLDTAEFKGEGNSPYSNRQVAVSALERFGFELALPTPIVVSSGYGLHVYWPMDSALAPDEWRETARALKRVCDKWGLKADHSRTTDIASILRVPGTHNRKNPTAPQRVKML